MVTAVCRNTFITFELAAESGDMDDDGIPASLCSPRLQPRSRSAESLRCRPEAAEFQEQSSHQSIERLNAVLSVGISSPKSSPKANMEVAGFMLDQPAFKLEEPCDSSSNCGLSELRSLQGKLAKALAGNSTSTSFCSPAMKPWDSHRRIDSTCSLSTMAPDDAISECGELPSSGGMMRMHHVWSSGSVSSMASMVSGFNETFPEDEDGEMEFELDIEAGAVAACEVEQQTPGKQRWADEFDEAADISSDEAATGTEEAQAPTVTRKTTVEMSHSSVPRNQNMEEMYNSSKDEPVTTMMIRNIPGRYSQNDLMMDLRDLGLAGTYDFLYMPMDKGTAANVGYAFVNFTTPLSADKCLRSFTDYQFSRHQRSSNKLANVSVAHLQGLEKNLQHYENAAVNMSKEKRRRPVVVANIAKMFG